MTTGKGIAMLGISLILIYAVTRILNFYGVGTEVYGIYLVFYLFMLLTIFILPNNPPTI
jgi:hypothetical protein